MQEYITQQTSYLKKKEGFGAFNKPVGNKKKAYTLPTAKFTRTFKVEGLILGGTKYKSKLGIMEMYEVAKRELTIAFPGNKKARAEVACMTNNKGEWRKEKKRKKKYE